MLIFIPISTLILSWACTPPHSKEMRDRDPKRTPPDLDNVIIAPADGFIRYIKRVNKETIPVSIKGKAQIPMRDFIGADMLGNGGWLIGVVMTYIDVYVLARMIIAD